MYNTMCREENLKKSNRNGKQVIYRSSSISLTHFYSSKHVLLFFFQKKDNGKLRVAKSDPSMPIGS